MCLAIPGKLVSVEDSTDPLLRTGEVDFSGIRKQISLGFVPEAKIGDYVLVHVGTAIQVINEDEATKILSYFSQLNLAEEFQENENTNKT
ncbi:MAG: HypC/HybG/HupF family hydrogenase formation chaperone [Chthoniobacterales bacterium]|nr:HypC/HybG/HupF family hydrogenase formation chaperone [Chthoniobacterales bacterium]MCX7712729.1 HypC/HybG/HupF family hydrogenase formation chaperone [Chthoniobacterales bacterium]